MSLIQKARDLYLRYGIRSITMSDIARELGVSKKTLYQEVSSKEELVKKVFEFDLEESRNHMIQIQSQSKDAIEQMVQTTIFLMQRMRKLSPVTHYDLQKYYGPLWSDLESKHLEFIYEFLKKNITWGKSMGLYRENIDAEIIARFFIHKASMAVDEVYFPLETYQRDDLLMQLLSYHINGITTPQSVLLWKSYQSIITKEQKKGK
jgi:AcrR family transcriptional regulator